MQFEGGAEGCQSTACPVVEVDATDAGDVFAAAFLLEFAGRGDVAMAARFVDKEASLAVSDTGRKRF